LCFKAFWFYAKRLFYAQHKCADKKAMPLTNNKIMSHKVYLFLAKKKIQISVKY